MGLKTLKNTMQIAVALYFVYAFFLLIETFDFLEILHTKPPHDHPTYNVVNVMYYQMEMIICFLCGFALVILVSTQQTVKTILYTNIVLFIFRLTVVYYLYFYTTEERWIPFIYKKGNELSPFFRGTLVPAQLVVGLVSIGYGVKALKISNQVSQKPD